MGIKENLKIKRKELDLTLEEASQKLGIKRSTLQRYESGAITNIPADNIVKLAEIYHTTPAQLMGWADSFNNETANGKEGDMPSLHRFALPILGEPASDGSRMCEPLFEGYVEMGSAIRADFCLRAKGDGMINARIQNGDIVFIRRQDDVEDGEVAAVLIEDKPTLKRVYKHGDWIQLQADNPNVRPILYRAGETPNIRIIGKAIAFQSNVE
ncbi:MAG: XRE family transcriptional regulator [Firmicutes bacterium]|nr:XRE family transcriptional regulator [Bacillota bacterium]